MRTQWPTLVMGSALFIFSGCGRPGNLLQPSVPPESTPVVTPSLVGRITVSVEGRFRSGEPGLLTITEDGTALTRLAVDWGDGTVTDLEPVGRGASHKLSHVYVSAGTYVLTVRMEDAAGGAIHASSSLFVQ